MGIVYLVGAGCGDPGLLTCKGKACLSKADVIFYDRLIDPSLLSLAKAECQCYYVGKQNRHHTMAQADINAALIAAAQEHEVVVRLKGGDPYVFGRGGEEALALYEANIPFEVIPGVSSSIGGLAYAGIPITHRGIARGVRIYTAHTMQDAFPSFKDAKLANSEDTLVFLMGLSNIKEIAEQLLAQGMRKDRPAAICTHLSTPLQHCAVTTLEQLPEMDLTRFSSPGILVIGEVVSLREQLCFYERKVLFHQRYLLMSVKEKEEFIEQGLRDAGAQVERVQCAQCESIAQPWNKRVLQSYTHVIFTSVNAIHIFFQQLFASGLDVRALSSHCICAMGARCKAVLQTYGILADVLPDVYDSTHMVKTLLPQLDASAHVLIPKADNDNTLLQDGLRMRCKVDVVPIYRMKLRELPLLTGHFDGIIVTCATSAHQLPHCYQGAKDVAVYVIGHATKQACLQVGFTNIIELPQADKRLFVDTIIKRKEFDNRCTEVED